MKDPAFLFYSKDFYEGTRMMLPEERACYVDLLIYQHQNGVIPFDLKRVLMYCNGVDLTTLEATLKAKFEETENGYINKRLNDSISERENYKKNQSESGKIGQFFKKSKAILSKKEFLQLQKLNTNKQIILDFISNSDINEHTLKGLLNQCLSNNANGDAIANGDGNKDKGGVGEKIPEFVDFWQYTKNFISEKQIGNPDDYEIVVEAKYNQWRGNSWKDGNNKKISNWKTKIQNTLPYLKPIKNGKSNTNGKSEPVAGRQSAETIANNLKGWE